MIIKCLIVGLGGAIGTIMRYILGLIPLNETNGFPINTFLINILGCIAIGFIVFYATKSNFDERLLLFLKVGICGGFTTFSTFAIETGDLLKNGNTTIDLTYVILTVLIGVLEVFLPDILIHNQIN